MRLSPKYLIPLMLLFSLLISIDIEAQCAMCRAVLESDVSADGPIVSRGINNGILYLMGIPYVLMLAVAIFVFRDKIKALFKRTA